MNEYATYRISSAEDGPQFLCDLGFVPADHTNEECLSDPAEMLLDEHVHRAGGRMIHIAPDMDKTRVPLAECGLLFSILQCQVDCSVILLFFGGKNEKVYVNGRLCGFANNQHLLQIDLFSGENVLVIETNRANPAAFLIRLSTDPYEMQADVSVFYHNFRMTGVAVDVLDKGYDPSKRGIYEFYVIPTTKAIDTSQGVRVEVMESLSRMLLYVDYIPFETWGRIDLTEYEYPHDAPNELSVRFLYQTYAYGEWMESRSFSFYPMAGQITAFTKHLERLASRTDLEENAKNCVAYYRAELEKKDFSAPSTVSFVLNVQRDMEGIIRNGRRRTYYDKPGVAYLYHRSSLDGRMIRIPIRVPVGYRPDRKMPLIMHYDLLAFDTSCMAITINDALVMNMTGRGFTFGGYVGEATFFEILQVVKKYYRIDERRIFGIGHCGAGVALMNLAMNHPGLFAGLYLSECKVEPYRLRYLSQLSLICINCEVMPGVRSGNCEVLPGAQSGQDLPTAETGRCPRLIEKKISCITHDMMLRCYLQQNLLKQLVNASIPRRQSHFRFYARGNRYRSAYWVRIDGMRSPEREGTVEVLCASSSEIVIRTERIIGMTLTLPPTFLRRCVDVRVDGSVFRLAEDHKRRLHFSCADGRWQICRLPVPAGAIYEGLGLLDVYMSPLLVWNPVRDDAACRLTAEAFAAPHTNANQSTIFVSYPIVAEVTEKDIAEHSVIVLDDLRETDDPVLRKIRSSLPVQCRKDGFTYKGHTYAGEWCLMQVCTNPWNPTMSVLHIAFSDARALGTNLFTRKVVLPCMTNRKHPYLNANVLICHDGAYVTDL